MTDNKNSGVHGLHKTTFATTHGDLFHILDDVQDCKCRFSFRVVDIFNIYVTVYGLLTDITEFMFLSGVGESAFSEIVEVE